MDKQLEIREGEMGGLPSEFTVANILAQVIKERDFVVIRGSVEPKRDFMLKLFALGRLQSSIASQDIHELKNGETLFTVVVRVWNEAGQSESMGSCALSEIEDRKSAQSGDFARRYHDCFAIAETRGLKRAIEAKAGVAFINEILCKVFPEHFKGRPSETKQSTQPTQNGWKLPEEWKNDVEAMGEELATDHFTDDERAKARAQIKKAKTIEDLRSIRASWHLEWEEREKTMDDVAENTLY